jgi:hypothetical protein
MKKFTVSNDKIQEGDFIIDIENPDVVVKCVKILNQDDLIWESLDRKSSACDSIFLFKKIIQNKQMKEKNQKLIKEIESLTLSTVKDHTDSSFHSMMKYIEEYEKLLKYPEYITKPVLAKNANSNDVLEYAEELKKYESDILVFKEKQKEIRKLSSILNTLKEEVVKECTNFYGIVPEQYQSNVWNLAWQNGHARGYTKVYGKLLDLINIFN